MLKIDGSMGEGGGQVLRTSLALSLVTGIPFRIERIRAGRSKPGLLRQHLTAVNAAVQVGRARVEGAALGSTELTFEPGKIHPGEHHFAVGTAGSTTLVFQTVLPALLTAAGPSVLTVEGGTHNPAAPPFDFLTKAFLPLIRRMGPNVAATLERAGFYPAGGGRIRVTVNPAEKLSRLDLNERGPVERKLARAIVARLDPRIAHREIKAVRDLLSWERDSLRVEEIADSAGPGNFLCLEVESRHITEVFSGFGERAVPAERVAALAVEEVRRYLASGAPVGLHLADQLLIPLAIAGGGSFRTLAASRHTLTNIEVVKLFLPVKVAAEQVERDVWSIEIGAR